MRMMKSVDLIRELKVAGWILDRFVNPIMSCGIRPALVHVVVPHPQKDLGIGSVRAIRRQAEFCRRLDA